MTIQRNKKTRDEKPLGKVHAQLGDFVSISSATGLICSTCHEHGQISSGARPKFEIFDGRLNLISSIRWGSGRIVSIFWETDRDIVNVLTENGKLLQVRAFYFGPY